MHVDARAICMQGPRTCSSTPFWGTIFHSDMHAISSMHIIHACKQLAGWKYCWCFATISFVDQEGALVRTPCMHTWSEILLINVLQARTDEPAGPSDKSKVPLATRFFQSCICSFCESCTHPWINFIHALYIGMHALNLSGQKSKLQRNQMMKKQPQQHTCMHGRKRL